MKKKKINWRNSWLLWPFKDHIALYLLLKKSKFMKAASLASKNTLRDFFLSSKSLLKGLQKATNAKVSSISYTKRTWKCTHPFCKIQQERPSVLLLSMMKRQQLNSSRPCKKISSTSATSFLHTYCPRISTKRPTLSWTFWSNNPNREKRNRPKPFIRPYRNSCGRSSSRRCKRAPQMQQLQIRSLDLSLIILRSWSSQARSLLMLLLKRWVIW